MKNANKFRLLMLFSAILAIAVSCSKNNKSQDSDINDGRRQVMSDQNDIEKEEHPVELPDYTHIMRLEDTTLTLYEIIDGEEIALTSVTIDPSYYPSEDIKELNQGLIAYSKEEGFARMENFAN